MIGILILTSCVAVKPSIPKMEINDLPAGYAAVFIAVTNDIPSNDLEIHFNDRFNAYLKTNAINKIYLPQDWYTLQLQRLPQDIDNASMSYRFSAGEISRFVLLRQSEAVPTENGDPQIAQTVSYTFAVSTAFGFDLMQQQTPLPVVFIVPQERPDSEN